MRKEEEVVSRGGGGVEIAWHESCLLRSAMLFHLEQDCLLHEMKCHVSYNILARRDSALYLSLTPSPSLFLAHLSSSPRHLSRHATCLSLPPFHPPFLSTLLFDTNWFTTLHSSFRST